MNRSLPHIKILLYPLSVLYRLVVGIRNWLFDTRVLPSEKFDIPVISIGNITVGGTGKTPHTEYMLRLLLPEMKVAMLSRGYKRHTRGFVLADETATSRTIGDEPYQIKRKFSEAIVAVDGNRRRGINTVISSEDDLGAFVLDDAYQHRYVEPGISILLVDYNRLITKDHMLPLGDLREPAPNKNRANIVIVTKCPNTAQPIDFRIITKELALQPYQNLYFTKYKYGNILPVFESECLAPKLATNDLYSKRYDVLLFTGIVTQKNIINYLNNFARNVTGLEYPDHHTYLEKDMQDIQKRFDEIDNVHKIIITTEKDAARLLSNPYVTEEIQQVVYALPIEVEFLFNQAKDFNEQILGYVRKNKTNRGLYKK